MSKHGKMYCHKKKKNNFIILFKKNYMLFSGNRKKNKKQIMGQNLFIMQEIPLLLLNRYK
jgi:hypothetical protein